MRFFVVAVLSSICSAAFGQFGNDFVLQKVVPSTTFIDNNSNGLGSRDALQIGNYLYVCFGYNSSSSPKGALYIYDVADPANPTLTKELTFTDRWFSKMLLENNTLYIVGKGVTIFDVTQVTNPLAIAFHTQTTGSQVYTIEGGEIDKLGSYLFFDRGIDGVMCVSMSNLTSTPVYVSKRNMSGSGYVGVAIPNANTVVSFDDYDGYYSTLNNGVLTADGGVSIPGFPWDVTYIASLGLAFVISEPSLGGVATLSALNVGTRLLAGQLDVSATFSYPGTITYSNGVVMIKDQFTNGFMTINVSNPAAMTLIKKYPAPPNSSISTSSCFRYMEASGLLIVGEGKKFNIYKSGTVVAPPTIIGFSPVSGTVGSTVTITGSNFSATPSGNLVKFNGVVATVTSSSSSSISTTVPPAASTGTITVTVGSQTATSASSFTVTSTNPSITSFAPASGPVGTSVVINGSNFSTTPSNNVVKFNGVTAVVTASTATSITTSVPATATSGPITVTVGGIAGASSSNFTVTSLTAPAITSFTPISGPVGTTVTITGLRFNTTPSGNIVKFNGTTATVTASTATSITTSVPVGATTGAISVTVGAETATSSSSYFVTSPTSPVITSFTPSNGVVGAQVTLTGSNFSAVAGNNIVKFNGVTAVVSASTTTSITTTVPTGATTGPITVTVGSESGISTSNFTVGTGDPTINSFSPTSGTIGSLVIINGTNFSTVPSENTVKFNGVQEAVSSSTATSITTSVPMGATTGPIQVTVNGKSVTSTTNFTVISLTAPTVTTFSPISGLIGTTVTITGSNFSTTPANNTVKFNGTTATVTASTATSIAAVVPAGATSGVITVTVGSETGTSANSFTVIFPTPTITSFSPTTGPVGTTVTLTGTNFSAIPNENTVKFNGTEAVITASTSTSITVSVPPGAQTGPISVIVNGQTGSSTSNFTVTAAPVPTITSFTPTSGAAGSAVTITGTNFSSTVENNVVKFNGTVGVVSASTATSISVTVPVGATTGPITVTIGSQTATSATNFTVVTCTKPPRPTISATGIDTESPTLSSSSSAGNQWFLNGAPITSATNQTLVVTAPGIYSVLVTAAGGCISDPSEDYVIIVTGDLSYLASSPLNFYPNPADDKITIEVPIPGQKQVTLFTSTGKVISRESFHKHSTEVHVDRYETGLYYFVVVTPKGSLTGKFLKK